MAVYKATYCYPFLNTYDIRVARYQDESAPCLYLKCKIDTSNKNVTGYSIRILDEANNVIFPLNGEERISPIAELAYGKDGIATLNGINSGINGTYLYIPFFQSLKDPISQSANAIYYKVKYKVDHVVGADIKGPKTEWTTDNINPKWTDCSDTDKWSYDSSNNLLKPAIEAGGDPDRILVGGEPLLEGETVVVLNSVSSNNEGDSTPGIWIVGRYPTANDPIGEICLKPFMIDNQPNNTIVVLKGNNHNKIYMYDSGEGKYIKSENVINQWICYNIDDGSEINLPGLSIDGRTYKWEITLYQGDFYFKNDSSPNRHRFTPYDSLNYIWQSRPSDKIPIVQYDGVSAEWLDMKMTLGTILGSTPERIQLVDQTENEIPSAGKDNTLVLQTRYLQLGNYNNANGVFTYTGDRIYIETYDATYGHAYPDKNSLAINTIDSSNSGCFYKYTNDPNAILKQDRIPYSINSELQLKIIDATWAHPGEFEVNDTTGWGQISAVNRLIIVKTPIEGRVEKEKNVLLTGQGHKYTNGVYQYYTYTVEATSTTYNCLKRANSYTTWGDYIGKIIYCETGDWAHQNVESMASAGGTLWDPRNATISGDSELVFTSEMPILLFYQKIAKTATVYSHTNRDDDPIDSNIDGHQIQVFDTIMFKEGKWGVVESISPSVTLGETGQINPDDYYYISLGNNYGRRVFKLVGAGASAPIPNWDLYTAKIAKNTITRTYISPYINLNKDMQLKLLNGVQIQYATEAEPTSWIKFNSINNKTWSIIHNPLVKAIPSYSIDDLLVPYKYEVRSFFRTSDQNVFYSFETPYLRLFLDRKPFVNITQINTNDAFSIFQRLQSANTVPFFLTANDFKSNSEITSSFVFNIGITIKGRSVRLGAEYIQPQQSSWESYRWCLLNIDGELLQDTGKRHDKTMEVEFYGLANDIDRSNVYYAILYVDDDLGQTLQYIIQITVLPAVEPEPQLQTIFTAKFDNTTHSVILNYQDYVVTLPSYRIGLADYVYDSTFNPDVPSLWDEGISYETVPSLLLFDNNKDVLSVQSDIIPIYNNELVSYIDSNNVQMTTKADYLGVNYVNFFGRNITKSVYDPDNPNILSIEDQEEEEAGGEKEEKGEYFFETSFALDDNFADSNIVSVNIEAGLTYDAPVIYLQGGGRDLTGYLSISLQLGATYNNENMLNDNRNNFYLVIDNHLAQETKRIQINNITAFQTQTDIKYAVQIAPPEKLTESSEYLYIPETPLYQILIQDKDTKKISSDRVYNQANKFLGNCNIIRPKDIPKQFDEEKKYNLKDGAPSYWVEDRPYLKMVQDNKFILDENQGIHLINDRIDSHSWPEGEGEEGEEYCYWNESGSESGSSALTTMPETWDLLITGNASDYNFLTKLRGVNHHSGMTNHFYTFQLKVYDVEKLYMYANNVELTLDGEITYKERIESGQEITYVLGKIALIKEGGGR